MNDFDLDNDGNYANLKRDVAYLRSMRKSYIYLDIDDICHDHNYSQHTTEDNFVEHR